MTVECETDYLAFFNCARSQECSSLRSCNFFYKVVGIYTYSLVPITDILKWKGIGLKSKRNVNSSYIYNYTNNV